MSVAIKIKQMRTLILAIYIALSPFCASKILYTMEDLETLERSKNYLEFIEHARDIRPSQRDKKWHDMLSSMAVGLVKEKLKFKQIDEAELSYIENMATWPELKSDAFFQSKREGYFLAYVDYCYKNQKKDFCAKQINRFWVSSLQNVDTGVEIAKRANKKDPELNFYHLIKKAVTGEFSNFYCKRGFIKSHLFEKLYFQLQGIESFPRIKSKIKNFISDACFKEFKGDLAVHLFSRKKAHREFSFKVLNAYNQISQKDRDLFLTLYLLEVPVVGKIFNLAWNNLKELGTDAKRRDSVLQRIRNMDPLPDQLFSLHNKLKKETIVKFFNRHFPEYLDHYAKTCVNYLKGVGHFPNGNPTVNCDHYFKANETPWITQQLKLQYSAIKKP